MIINPLPLETYSFEGQDRILWSILRDVESGNYLDIGCNHPIDENNTYLFYKRGWKGVCIDPNTIFAKEYETLRPRDTFINTAISNHSDTSIKFYKNEDNRLSTCDLNTYQKYSEHIEHGSNTVIVEEVKTTNINSIIRDHMPNKLDLLCVDTEGSEYEIIKSLDPNGVRPKVMCIEIKLVNLAKTAEDELIKHLRSINYSLIAKTPLDSIFVDSSNPPDWLPLEMFN